MLTIEEARTRVARGIAFLDGVQPDWRAKIRHYPVSIQSSAFCVLGQIYGGYSLGIKEFGWASHSEVPFDAPQVQHGFTISAADAVRPLRLSIFASREELLADLNDSSTQGAWQTLTRAWNEALAPATVEEHEHRFLVAV